MKKADNFNAGKWLVENKITFQSRLTEAEELLNIEWDELEKMAFSAISAYNKENGLDPIQSVRVTSSGNSYDENKAVQANVTVKTNTGEEMDYRLTWDKDLNLSKLIPPYKSTNTPQLNKKQKDGDSKPISLTPEQKKEFKSAIRDLKKIEDLEYALGEAGNVLANILTNGKAEFIEDVEDFGYDADEVEQYAIDLAGGVENKITTQSKLNEVENNALSPNMQKQFNMIVSALKRAKSQEDIDQVHSNLMLLPKKLTKIFIDKLVNMGLANREGEGKYSLDYDDGLDESKLDEGKVKNQYVVKDEEESDEYGDFYVIDKKKAFEYLKQFDKRGSVNAKQFIKDDEGWGEFEQYLEDVELMSDKELEDAMREDMSMYFFSNPDEI